MMKTIEIIIDSDGQTTLQTKGFAGTSCKEASRELERALGLIESERPTSELYQTTHTQTEARQNSGF